MYAQYPNMKDFAKRANNIKSARGIRVRRNGCILYVLTIKSESDFLYVVARWVG
ncbi:hypothetical protein M413DRAFT_447802 [Hebeloma cylindrosporum]|uniref:Uncharacterized protein n=1 Tax=Hebeloma cylindrosporum TaxID=76867 RepID=A0A0C3BNQ3_HEBCY|nr:hypothetical protein M413DRAFT_447802 [Hebeloma cylindrosporum h7]